MFFTTWGQVIVNVMLDVVRKEDLDKVQFVIGKTKHYPFGKYEVESDGNPIMGGNIYEFHDIISVQLNQLKGKLFNLIEATSTDQKQQEALKGLVRGFCNTAYNNSVTDIGGLFRRLGFEVEDWVMNSHTPLVEGSKLDAAN